MTAQSKKNAWRLEGAGSTAWRPRLDTGAPDKYLVVSCDTHTNEPLDYLSGRIEAKYVDRLPHVRTDPDGTQWLISEGAPPQPVRVAPQREDLILSPEDFESFEVAAPYTEKMEAEDVGRSVSGRSVAQRVEHGISEGVDAEIIFGNRGLFGFATPDIEFANAMCHGWNLWAKDTFSDYPGLMPMAMIVPGDLKRAIAEVHWAAQNGFHGILLPNRPVYHRKDQPRHPLEYNDKSFEPLWAAIEETGLPITLHVSTGEDPRAVRGYGGAVTNFVCHSMTTTVEPMVQLIASGVFERHPKLRLGTIESGIGWVLWLLQQMDYAYKAHHMWVRPVIPNEPSFYYKQNCFSAFIEEPGALEAVIEAGLEDNIVWSNDYPHHEGSFPHTKAAIERQMANLTETQRAKVLGLNAARFFNLPTSASSAFYAKPQAA